MNCDIVRCILYESLYSDIRSIKKTSLICKQWSEYISNLSTKDDIKNKLDIIYKYIDVPNVCMAYAARNGHMDIVLFMIEKGATFRNNAMFYAAFGGHMDIVQLMIEKGANNWNYAMSNAAIYGHMDIVNLLEQYQS